MIVQSRVFNAADQVLLLPPQGERSLIFFQIVGSGTLTLVLEDSLDGANYVIQRVRDVASFVEAGSASAAGLYRGIPGPPYTRPRIRCSAFTSGSFTVYAHIRGL